jgi:hypothetical protein
MHQTTDFQKTSLTKLMVATDWYNWNNAFINNCHRLWACIVAFGEALSQWRSIGTHFGDALS